MDVYGKKPIFQFDAQIPSFQVEDFHKALPGGEAAQEHCCLTAPFERKLPGEVVKYFAIAAQFFMLFLTLAFLKP